MDPNNLMSAAKASLRFDFGSLVRKPQLILRIITLLFSIIVFGCISSGGHVHKTCIFDKDRSACSYATGIGVIAFLGAVLFIVADIMFDKVSNIKRRKHIILADVVFSTVWTFLWFVSFCLLANKWSNTPAKWISHMKIKTWQSNNARSAICFSFLSVGVWAAIAFFAVKRFREGMQGSFEPAGDIEQQVGSLEPGMVGGDVGGAPYSAYPGVDGSSGGDMSGAGNYHDTPFNGAGGGGGQYYPPTY